MRCRSDARPIYLEPTFMVGSFFVGGDDIMKYRYLGTLKPNIAEYWKISEHKNKPIVVFDDRINHVIEKHLSDFKNKENILLTYNNLDKIIKNPDYVFYNQKTKGLEYYKNLNKNICAAVRINPGNILKVKSWYPANANKINNRKAKEEKIINNI